MPPFATANLRIDVAPAGVATLWLDVADRPFNVFSLPVLADLDAAFDHLATARDVKLLIIRSAKPTGFIAGADLHEFLKIQSPAEAAALSKRGQDLFAKLARLPAPSIAVISGPCLGGGLELALACDYRLAVDHPKTQIGLPEIELGLLPGWGGTQRLPRVIGLESALRVILGGKRLKGRDAHRWGLADALVATDVEATLKPLCERALRDGKRSLARLPLRTWRQRFLESTPPGRYLVFRGARTMLKKKVPDDMPAPAAALEAVRVGMSKGMEAGFAYERDASSRLAVTPACHNLVSLFFQREKARKLPSELRADLVAPVKKVGVVGVGTMGAGIAQLAAVRGCQVVVQEVNDAALNAGKQKIDALFQKAVENRVLGEGEARAKREALTYTTTWAKFDALDLVVEAVIEDLELKRRVFRELETRTRAEAFLATNTSSLLVEKIQDGAQRPERIGGLHFFNPVHKMPLIEVVRGPATDEATVATLTQWAIDLGKTPVVVKDSPGFLVNRILMPYLYEAVIFLIEAINVEALGEGQCAEVDRIMRRFGMPLGPFELLDQIGLDVASHVEKSMRPAFEHRFKPNPLFERMVERGWLGQKSGTGFYRYKGKSKKPNSELSHIFPEDMMSPLDFDDLATQVCKRLVLPMVNESAVCLAEELVTDAESVDRAMVFGTGWAPHRGGPLHYADQRGLKIIVDMMLELAKHHGPRFEPCAELRRRAAHDEGFFTTSVSVAGV